MEPGQAGEATLTLDTTCERKCSARLCEVIDAAYPELEGSESAVAVAAGDSRNSGSGMQRRDEKFSKSSRPLIPYFSSLAEMHDDSAAADGLVEVVIIHDLLHTIGIIR